MRLFRVAIVMIVCLIPFPAFAKNKSKKQVKPRFILTINQESKKKEFVAGLLKNVSKDRVDMVVYDERFALDHRVTGILTKEELEVERNKPHNPPCSYFDPCFGLLSDASLDRGNEYWLKHQTVFIESEDCYSVPSEIVLGILRVESNFGKASLGRFSVINTFYSLFVYSREKKRSFAALAQARLFLRYVWVSGRDPFLYYGSYAGAFGVPQFLPSSFVSFARDGNGDGIIDLWDDDDVVASIAYYLAKNGWGATRKEQERAVMAYNHSKAYTKAVLAYANTVKKVIQR